MHRTSTGVKGKKKDGLLARKPGPRCISTTSFPPSLVDNCGLLLIESSISPTSTKGIQWRKKEMSMCASEVRMRSSTLKYTLSLAPLDIFNTVEGKWSFEAIL